MARFRSIAAHVLLTAFGVLLGGMALFLLRGGASYLPVIEGYLSPVSEVVGRPNDLFRDSKQACFSLTIKKKRAAVPETYQFKAEVRQNENWLLPISLNAHLASLGNMPLDEKTFLAHAVGETWTRHWCFDTPGTVADSQVMRISGYAVHRAHPFWKTETALTPFVIGPVPQP